MAADKRVATIASNARHAVLAWLLPLSDGESGVRCYRVNCCQSAARRGEDRWEPAFRWDAKRVLTRIRPDHLIGVGLDPRIDAELLGAVERYFPIPLTVAPRPDVSRVDIESVQRRYDTTTGSVSVYCEALAGLLDATGLAMLPEPKVDMLELWCVGGGDACVVRTYEPSERSEAMAALAALDAVLGRVGSGGARLDEIDADGERVGYVLGARYA